MEIGGRDVSGRVGGGEGGSGGGGGDRGDVTIVVKWLTTPLFKS